MSDLSLVPRSPKSPQAQPPPPASAGTRGGPSIHIPQEPREETPEVEPDAFVLWVENLAGANLTPPRVLLTMAPPEAVAEWRTLNRWADQTPVVLFHSQAGVGQPFAEPPQDQAQAGMPWRVYCAEGLPDLPVWQARSVEERFRSIIAASAYLTRQYGAPTWEIQADASQGILTCGIAAACGGTAVALASGYPGQPLLAFAARHGISVSQRPNANPRASKRKDGL